MSESKSLFQALRRDRFFCFMAGIFVGSAWATFVLGVLLR